ncbi:MAG: hypothetical protein ACI8PW_001923 [Methylophilaceae bacterium]|jgi:hypothetical protein
MSLFKEAFNEVWVGQTKKYAKAPFLINQLVGLVKSLISVSGAFFELTQYRYLEQLLIRTFDFDQSLGHYLPKD